MVHRVPVVRAIVAPAAGHDGVPSCYAVRSPPWPFHRSAVIPRAAAGVPSVVVVATNEIVHLDTPLLARTVCTDENLHHDVQASFELRTGTGGGGRSDDRGTCSECDQQHVGRRMPRFEALRGIASFFPKKAVVAAARSFDLHRRFFERSEAVCARRPVQNRKKRSFFRTEHKTV